MSDDAADIAERKMQFLFALRSKGVTDKRVLTAMEKVDRGPFIRGYFAHRAYEDMPLPIACGQTISQPSVVGLMSQALKVSPRDKLLEVGTGSGYQAAILSHLARRVYTVDRHKRLVDEASAIFRELDLTNITAVTADGSFGLPDQAPFDRILVTAAAEDPPGPLLAQLKIGGIMVLPVGQSDAVQSLIRVTRHETGVRLRRVAPGALRAPGRGAGSRRLTARTSRKPEPRSTRGAGRGPIEMNFSRTSAPLLAGTAILMLTACSDQPLDFDLRGAFGNAPSTAEAAANATANRPEPDSRGIISYPGYQVAVARRGDTVASLASRIGVDPRELARYNGIQTGDLLRDGEVVALPGRVAEPSGGPITPAGRGRHHHPCG